MDEVVKNILNLAVYAPSGDNSQPWRFEGSGLVFNIINIPDRDNEIFNFRQRGSYIAHGALIQNIKFLASFYGYEARIDLFPKGEDPNAIARIELISAGSEKKLPEILNTVKARCTNRRKYSEEALTEKEKQEILSQAEGNVKAILVEEREKKEKIAGASSTAERVMLEYYPLHKAFFSMIRWNREEETKEQHGMLIDTLELLPPQKAIFKWFSHWNASRILRAIGLPKFIAKENSKIYASASAIVALEIPQERGEDFVYAGMTLQKIWLTATRLGISLQPIAGVLYLGERLKNKEIENLPGHLANLIQNSVKTIYNVFGNPSGHIAMVFRIGKSGPPTARSAKFLPNIA